MTTTDKKFSAVHTTFATKTNHSCFTNFAAIARRQFKFPCRFQIWQWKYL